MEMMNSADMRYKRSSEESVVCLFNHARLNPPQHDTKQFDVTTISIIWSGRRVIHRVFSRIHRSTRPASQNPCREYQIFFRIDPEYEHLLNLHLSLSLCLESTSRSIVCVVGKPSPHFR